MTRLGLAFGLTLLTLAPLAAQTPSLLWQDRIDGYADKPTVADLNGDNRLELVLATDSGRVYALDGRTGLRLWLQEFEDEAFYACPVVADVDGDGNVELIVVGGRHGRIFCLGGSGGAVRWQADALKDRIGGTPAFADLDGDGNSELIVTRGDPNPRMQAYRGINGELLWERPLPSRSNGSVTVADVNGDAKREVLFGLDRGALLCTDTRGRVLWTSELGGPVVKPPVVADVEGDGQADVFAVGNSVTRLDGAGNTVWRWAPPTGRGIASNLALGDVNGDRRPDLVMGGYDGRIYALDGAGKVIWQYVVVPPDAQGLVKYIPASTPALLDLNADGGADLVFATPNVEQPQIVAVSGKTGRALWSYDTTRFSQCAPVVADLDGDGGPEVLVCNAEGRCYALRLGAAPTAAGWLKFGGSLANTGNQREADATAAAVLRGRMPFEVAFREVPWANSLPPAPTPVPQPLPVPTPGVPPIAPSPPDSGPRPNTTVAVLINGVWGNLDPPAQILQGRVMVPLRGIFEALGAAVQYQAATKTIIATAGGKTIALPLGSTRATVDGRMVTLDVPAQNLQGRTFVPLRFVAEALQARVTWYGDQKNVYIDLK